MTTHTVGHTPGPWTCHYQKNAGLWTVRSQENGHRVAKDLLPDDARLVAAAPELLEAAQALLYPAEQWVQHLRTHVGPGQGHGMDEVFAKTRAAIARATGEQA